MESVVIIILVVLALVLTGALVAAIRRGSAGRESLDPHVLELKSELDKVTNLVRELEKDRENKFGELTSQLKSVGEYHRTGHNHRPVKGGFGQHPCQRTMG